MSWLKEMFHVEKPIIALLHLSPLPGDPGYDEKGGMEKVINQARLDLHALQDGGVDGVLISNEYSLPYENHLRHVTTAAMARIIGELKKEITIPYGVEAINDPDATIELAAAVEAYFVRSLFTGAYVGDGGITNKNVAATLRRKRELGLDKLRMLYFVTGESEVYINDREIEAITRSIKFRCKPDSLVVCGTSAGTSPNSEAILRCKKVAGDTPVICGTGCNIQTLKEKLDVCDGACVGTTLKYEGKFENFVDPKRVMEFMNAVKEYRAKL